MTYDNWLTKGSDYGQAEWEEWSESAMAEEAYAEFLFTHDWPLNDPPPFEQWLDTDDAEEAFQAARFPAFDDYDCDDHYLGSEASYDVV